MITAMSFLDVFEDYNAFKDFTDTIGLYPDTDTVSEAFNQSIYWNIVNRYGNTDVNYYEADPFKSEFTIAYEQYFKQFLSKKKIVDATNGITLDDYQIISESLSNFANNPNTLTTDPWELLTYTSQQQRGRAKAGKLTAYINALRQLPDAQIDAFLDKIDYMWSNLLSDSHACCGEDIDGTVVYVRGQYQRKWSPDTIIDNVELINEDVEDLKISKQDALSSTQLDAVNSGIDSTKVAQIQTNADNIVILQAIKYGASLQATIDTSTYIMTLQLKDQDGNNLGTAQTIDLPLESVVVSGSYDSVNKALVLTLQNGNTISIPVGDLISGLQPLIDSSHKLSADLVDDSTTTNKFVTANDKSTWNGKQDALSSTQLDAVNSGIDSTKVGQIATNTSNITSLQSGKQDINTAVLYSQAQTLTDAQKAQARSNIGAGSSGFSGDYSDLTSKPILDTTPTTAQTTSASETITGTIKLHKISKTGTLADAIEDSTHRTVTDTEKSTWSGKQNALDATQLSAVNSGIDSTKVGQIATNTSNITSLQNDRAKTDASNLSTTNVDSWASTCRFERVDLLYDSNSANSNINWGYTSGLKNNTTITGKDFSKYKCLRILCASDMPSNPARDIMDYMFIPLDNIGYAVTQGHYRGVLTMESYYTINGSNSATTVIQLVNFVVTINTQKTSLSVYAGEHVAASSQSWYNDQDRIYRVEGLY